jgi:hypothetical protein
MLRLSELDPREIKGVAKMRKWLGIGMLSVAIVGVGAYWFFTKTNGWTSKRGPVIENVRVAQNHGDEEASEVIEPLIVQPLHNTPAPEEVEGTEFGVELLLPPRAVLEPGMQQPPRPAVEPGTVNAARMPFADDEPGIGVWFFLDWSAIKAKLSKLNLFKEIEKADPAEEPENKETNPPMEQPQTLPVPDYHQQYPHCPYHGPCPAPYRLMPRD